MRVLCICNSGNVRSVTLGRQIKKRGGEVLCAGVDKAFKTNTIQMLVKWSEVIYAQRDCVDALLGHIYTFPDGYDPDIQSKKIDTRFDVGPDDWKIPDHPDLHRRIRDMLMNDKEWGSRNSDNA